MHGAPDSQAVASAPVMMPLATQTSQISEGFPEQAFASALLGAEPSASPPRGQQSLLAEQQSWHRSSVEFVTYELELDTGSCKVSAQPHNSPTQFMP